MKKMLMRPSSALFPLALIGAYQFGWDHLTMVFVISYFLLQICSLCAVDAFRNAAAREPSPRKMDHRFGASIIPLIAGLGIGALAMYSNDDFHYFFLLGAAWLIIIEQLFEERLFSLNRNADGTLLAFVSNALMMAALILDGVDGIPTPFTRIDFGFCTLCAGFVSALIGLIVNLVAAPFKGFSIAPKNLLFAPKAMVQALLFPMLAFGFCWVTVDIGSPYGYRSFQQELINNLASFLPGLVAWRLLRTTCRRSNAESRLPNLIIVAVACISFTLIFTHDIFMTITANAFLLFFCAMVVYLAPSVRLYAAAVIYYACFILFAVYDQTQIWPIAAASAVAILLNLKNAFIRKK